MKRVAALKVYRLFYPAVPVLVAASHKGRVSAMPAVSVISLSGEPALIGVSSSPSHATHKAVVGAGCLSVSWFDRRYAPTLEAMGNTSGSEVGDKLGAAGLHYTLGGSLEVPVIAEASAYLACRLSSVKRFGDHELLVGEVREARAISDFREYWSFRDYHPFLYAGVGRRLPGGADLVRRP